MTPASIDLRTDAGRNARAETWRSPHGRSLPALGARTLVMGILNVTPDSFSDGGELRDVQRVVDRAQAMLQGGADVLDIGGESTRPGANPVGEGEELSRVLPAIRALRAKWPEVPLSIDTFKPRVAEAAIHAGADIVNDVWGFTHGFDAETRAVALGGLARVGAGVDVAAPLPRSAMAAAVARLHCPVILTHNRPSGGYGDFWAELLNDLRFSVALAERAGIPRHQIWLDPGFGFAKTPAQNLEVIKNLDRVTALGFPVLVGTSRKSTLGKVLGTTVDDRMEGTAATTVWAVEHGASMIRVHDVAIMKRVATMTDALKAGLDFKVSD